MDAPRTRYQVVERGRRLEVIDTWNGNVAVNPARPDPAQRAPRRDALAAWDSMRRDRARVSATRTPSPNQGARPPLLTSAWYDDKGPREIVVSDAGAEKLKGLRIVVFTLLLIAAIAAVLFWPLLFIVAFVISSEGTRKSLRTASTRFLDDLDQPVNGYGGA